MPSIGAENEPEKKWPAVLVSRLITHLQQREELVFLLLSLMIGAFTGLAVVAFIVLTERLGMRLYPVGGAAWRRVLVPVAGSLAMGVLLYRFFPNARGSGVPQTKAALFARDGFISLRTVLGKFFCTATTLASGIPLGREGPSAQVGAGIGSVLGRWLGLRPEKVKALIPVGAAAAIAAAFNTPMAAVLFSLEEVMGDMHAPILGSVVLASATSWAVLRLLLGNNPLFQVPQYTLVHPLELAIYALLGIAGGFLSVAFTRFLLGMRKFFLHLPERTRWWHPVAGGVTVGLMGWFVPQVDPSLLAQPSRSDMPPVSPRALAAPGSPRYTYRTQLMNFSVAAIWLSLKAVPISSRPQFGAVRTTCRGRRMSPRARRDCHLERCWTHAQPVHSRTPFGETGHTTQLPCAFDTS
jgi:H+/Cl- antiporter ClcA